MKKNSNLKITFILLVLISGLLFLLILIDYNKAQAKAFQHVATNTLNETMKQQKIGIATQLETEVGLLKTIANSIPLVENEDNIISLLKNIEPNTHYKLLAWVNTNMEIISHNGVTLNLKDKSIIARAMTGETIISNPIYSATDELLIILVATPSYNNEGIVNGAVCGVYTPEKLKSLVTSSFNGESVTHIVNKEGQYIASSLLNLDYTYDISTDISTMLEAATFEDGSIESVISDIQANLSGQMSFSIGDEKYQTAYSPLGINDWAIVITVPTYELIKSSGEFQNRTSYLSISFGLVFLIVVFLFIYQEERSNKKLFRTAYYDELTKLPNTTRFKLDAQKLIEEFPNDKFSCIILDIFNFKLINDSYGYKSGDLILEEIGKLGKLYVKERGGESIVGRLHSDVFIILSRESEDKDSESIKSYLISSCRGNVNSFRGIKLDFYLGRYISEPSENIDQIIERTTVAHSHAKGCAINEFVNYDSTIVKELYLINSILNEFDNALNNGEFKLYIQPQFNAQTEKMSGAEVLVRWIKNKTVKYRPDEFIPILEKTGDIIRLDEYIREQVYSTLKRWENENIDIPSLSVNVSRFDLLQPNFIKNIVELAKKYDVKASKLHLEITETAYTENHIKMIEVVKDLQNQGFSVEMDDFGSGYSSLNILKDLPLDVLKLDMKFLKDYSNNHNGEIIVTSIIEMAKKLNLKVIAEGTETKQQVNYLRSIGCDELQGYYFARPMPIDEFEILLKSTYKTT